MARPVTRSPGCPQAVPWATSALSSAESPKVSPPPPPCHHHGVGCEDTTVAVRVPAHVPIPLPVPPHLHVVHHHLVGQVAAVLCLIHLLVQQRLQGGRGVHGELRVGRPLLDLPSTLQSTLILQHIPPPYPSQPTPTTICPQGTETIYMSSLPHPALGQSEGVLLNHPHPQSGDIPPILQARTWAMLMPQ